MNKVTRVFKKMNKRKSFLTYLLLFSFFLTIIPFNYADALLARAIGALPLLLITLHLGLAVVVTAFFSQLAIALLSWVISPNFMPESFGYTQNPVTEIGLQITGGFVNIILVVILIWIAVNIALSLNEKDSKRMLGFLILIALVVNFAPLLVGIIVDAANVISNFFLKEIRDMSGFMVQLGSWGNSTTANLRRFASSGDFLGAAGGVVGQSAGLILFNIFGGIIFLLFAFLFLFRYIAIWVITILSPLAILAYILPATRDLFKTWWNALIQWAFIAVPISFFLYLGLRIMEVLPEAMRGVELETLEDSMTARFFGNLLPYTVALVFLFIGFMLSLQIKAPGTDKVKAEYQKGTEKLKNYSKEKGKNLKDKAISRAGNMGQGKGGKLGQGLRWAGHRVKPAADAANQRTKSKEDKETKEWIDKHSPEYLQKNIGDLRGRKLQAAGKKLLEKEKFAKLKKEEKEKVLNSFKANKDEESIKTALPYALGESSPEYINEIVESLLKNKLPSDQEINNKIEARRSDPRFKDESMENSREAVNKEVRKPERKKLFDKMSAIEASKVTKGMVENKEFKDALVRNKPVSYWVSLEENPETRGCMLEMFNKLQENKEFFVETMTKNRSLLLSLISSPSSKILLGDKIRGMGEKELRQLISTQGINENNLDTEIQKVISQNGNKPKIVSGSSMSIEDAKKEGERKRQNN